MRISDWSSDVCSSDLLAGLTPLERLLDEWPHDRTLIFADEEGGEPLLDALPATAASAAILIGPEGGFDPAERTRILAVPTVRRVSLGPRVLRAATAAVAARSAEHTSELQSIRRISYAVFCL